MKTTRVLIVEDEGLIAEELRDRLEDLGHTVVGVVDTAAAAVEAVRRDAPGLVLMDIRLKGDEDGIDAAWVIGEVANVPVVFLTAHSDASTLDRAFLTRPFGYVVKPVREADLVTAVQTALLRHATESHARTGEARFRSLIDLATNPIVRAAPDGRVIGANPALGAELGYTGAEVCRLRLTDLVAEPDRAELSRAVYRVASGGQDFDLPVSLVARNGTTTAARAIARHAPAGTDVWVVFQRSPETRAEPAPAKAAP